MAYELIVTLAEKPTPAMIRVLQRLAVGHEIADLMGGLAWKESGKRKGMGEFVRFLRPPEVKALGALVAVGAITHPGGGDFSTGVDPYGFNITPLGRAMLGSGAAGS